jgi:Zn-dependent peptidase ImmA (M78 family)/DNA-binding XRE family transcriptional regulator
MNMEFNASRLTLARERRGYTKRAFAKKIGLTERAVGDWERGATVPTDEHVALVAQATGFPVGFFRLDDADDLPKDVVSFRALHRLAAADKNRALAAARMAFDLNSWLEKNFNLPALDIPAWDHFPGTPEAAAEALRRRWGLGDAPIKSMVALLEHKGVRVYSLAEDTTDMDAFAFWRNTTPFVFLNTRKSSERSRFDAAHELGHLVLHRDGAPLGRTAEAEANAFAGAFLMPASSIAAHAPRNPTLPSLIKAKRRWNVAVAALAHRLHVLGIISEWQYRGLRIEMQDKGYTKEEPESGPRESSQGFEKVFKALRDDGVYKRDLASRLCWPLEELNSLVFGLILSAVPGGAQEGSGPVPDIREKLRLVK